MNLDRLFLYGLLVYSGAIFLALSYFVVLGEIDVFNYLCISTLTLSMFVLICIELER